MIHANEVICHEKIENNVGSFISIFISKEGFLQRSDYRKKASLILDPEYHLSNPEYHWKLKS